MGNPAKDPCRTRGENADASPFHALGAQPIPNTSPRTSVAATPTFLAGPRPLYRNRRPGWERLRAFTSIDLTVIILLFAILIALMIPATAKAKAKARRINCVRNLGTIGLSFRVFATDHADRFPWAIATNMPPVKNYDEVLKSLLTVSNAIANPAAFACPADSRKPSPSWASFTRNNISYFLSPSASESFPQSFLAGDRNLMTNGIRLPSGIVKLSTNASVSWDSDMHHGQGNAAMGDGSIQQLSSAHLREQLKNTGTTETILAIP